MKVRLILLETGQLDQIVLHEFVPGTEDEATIRGRLAPVVEKVSFPTAELSPGTFTTESDVIVARFAERAAVEPGTLPTYQSYITGVFKSLQSLYRENIELKKRLAEA